MNISSISVQSPTLPADKLTALYAAFVAAPGKPNFTHLAAEHGLHRGTVRAVWRFWQAHHGQPPAPVETVFTPIQIDHDRELARLRDEHAATRKQYAAALKRIDEMETAHQHVLSIQQPVAPIRIGRPAPTEKDCSVAFAVASDWHFGANIRRNVTNGLNEYTPEIAQTRAEKYFINLLKMVKKERHGTRIDEIVLCLLGDFIENYLHPELVEEATISPIEQIRLVQASLQGGIDYLLKHGEFARIRVVTSPGNHGRTTERMMAATSYKNSFEQMMYLNLRDVYRKEERVHWQTEDGYASYVEVFGQTVRVSHGDAVKYQGGIGGIIIPLRKWSLRANMQRRADMSICGHFHSLLIDNDIMVNGSLCGASAYSLRLGFPPEPPQQIFRLLDARRGWTTYNPIFVD